MSGVFLVDEQIVGDAEVFLPGLFDQLPVKWQDGLDGFRPDEILGYDFEHRVAVLVGIGRCPDVQCPVAQGSMIGTPAARKALASRVATAKPWAVAMAAI